MADPDESTPPTWLATMEFDGFIPFDFGEMGEESIQLTQPTQLETTNRELVDASPIASTGTSITITSDISSTNTSTVPMAPTVPTGRSTDASRRKHRESMAQFRHERRHRIQQLDAEAGSLHARLRFSLQRKLVRQTSTTCTSRSPCRGQRCRCVAMAELVETAECLRQEQYALEDQLHRHHRLQRRLGVETQRVENESEVSQELPSSKRSDTGTGDPPPDTAGYWLQFLDGESPFYYEFESMEASAASVQRGLQSMARVHEALSPGQPNVLAAHCLGWKAERSITKASGGSSRPRLHFRFSRRVSRLRTSLVELQDKSWALLNSTELTARVYGSTVVSKVVQRLSEDTFINLRNSPARTNHTCFRQFTLNARLRSVDAESAMVLIMSIDKEPRQEQLEAVHFVEKNPNPDPDINTIVWIKSGCACLGFAHAGDDAIEIEYVGSMECVGDDHAAYLLVECCATLLRWEHMVVPPRLLAL